MRNAFDAFFSILKLIEGDTYGKEKEKDSY